MDIKQQCRQVLYEHVFTYCLKIITDHHSLKCVPILRWKQVQDHLGVGAKISRSLISHAIGEKSYKIIFRSIFLIWFLPDSDRGLPSPIFPWNITLSYRWTDDIMSINFCCKSFINYYFLACLYTTVLRKHVNTRTGYIFSGI